jgi:endonuclease YncB( thermonuclease family)
VRDWQSLWSGKIADSETLGLRPTGITQFALANIEDNQVKEWWFDAHRVISWGPLQDQAELSDYGPLQARHLQDRPSWMHSLAAEYGLSPGKALGAGLKSRAPWVAGKLEDGSWGHITGTRTPVERATQLAALGLQPQVVQRSIRGFFANEFLDELAGGGTLWIANAPFESSQVGAVMAGEKNAQALTAFKSAFETQTNVPSQLYVTGVNIQTARARAQVDGDWTRVWRAYLENPVPAGQVGVRDIQDVTRAMMSYGQQLGWLEGKDVYWGAGIDFQYRLSNVLEQGPSGMLVAEAHTAAEDAAVAEKRVLREHLENTWALREVAENTDVGKNLVAEAAKGTGPLYRVQKLFEMMNRARPELETRGIVQRYERAALDFIEKGVTKVTTSRDLKVDGRTVGVHGGSRAATDSVNYNYRLVTRFDDLTTLIKAENKYDAQIVDSMAEVFANTLADAPDPNVIRSLSQGLVDQATAAAYSAVIQPGTKTSVKAIGNVSKAATTLPTAVNVFKRVAPAWALGAGALAAIGGTVAWAQPERVRGEPSEPNLLSPTYYDWLARKEYQDATQVPPVATPRTVGIPGNGYPGAAAATARWNRWDGMGHGGIAGATRSQNTDFGSPYQGPTVSSEVIVSQDQARRREDWMLGQYGVRRFSAQDRDFWDSFFDWRAKFSAPMPRGYSFISGGTPVEDGRYATVQTRGKNLKEINLSESRFRFEAEDADTLILKPRGFINRVKEFMGVGESYAVRIAGVDAPEIQHGAKAGQPWGNEATMVAADILSKGNVTLIYDPDENTYGRSLGTLMVDGKNYSHELVKRGAASFLPFGKPEYSMIAFDGLADVEDRAHAAARGMWSTPYFDTIRQFDPDRQITNQTFVHDQRLASSLYVLSAQGLATQAQAAGEFRNYQGAVAEAQMGFNYSQAGNASKDGDRVRAGRIDMVAANPASMFMQQSRATAGMVRTRGPAVKASVQNSNPYGKLAQYQELDSQGQGTNPFSKRAYEAEVKYEAAEANRRWRKERMASDQNRALTVMYGNPINHHRMGS